MLIVPYNVDVGMERVPFTNWIIIGITVLVTIYDWGYTTGPYEIEHPVSSLALQPNRFEASQLFTHMLVHGGFWHLFGNMIFLFCFGNAINAKLGHIQYAAAYVFFGVLSGLAWLVAGNVMPVLGASGAIMGVVGAFFILYPKNDVSVWWLFWFLWLVRTGTFQVTSFWLILFYVGFDFLHFVTGAAGGVAYICHLAGAVAGAALAIVLIRSRVIQSTRYERNLLEMMSEKA